MQTSRRLILVDDDVELCEMLGEYLASESFAVDAVHDGNLAAPQILRGHYDMVILDVMLPGQNGKNVLRAVRATSQIPVLMLTARGDPADRIVGLELGADDYLAKPFEPKELVARINAILRRSTPAPNQAEIVVGDLRLTLGNRSTFVAGAPVVLTSLEFSVLAMLAERPGVIVSREELATALGRSLLPFDRAVDMHVVNLRKKLGVLPSGNPRILTVRSFGYMMAVEGWNP